MRQQKDREQNPSRDQFSLGALLIRVWCVVLILCRRMKISFYSNKLECLPTKAKVTTHERTLGDGGSPSCLRFVRLSQLLRPDQLVRSLATRSMTRSVYRGAFGYLSSAFSWTYALNANARRSVARPLGSAPGGASERASVERCLLRCGCGPRSQLVLRSAPPPGASANLPRSPPMPRPWATGSRERKEVWQTAITDAAAKFSTAIGSSLIGLLLLYFGWRWSFAATGFISFLYFVLFSFVYRISQRRQELSAQSWNLSCVAGLNPKIERDHKAAVRSVTS